MGVAALDVDGPCMSFSAVAALLVFRPRDRRGQTSNGCSNSRSRKLLRSLCPTFSEILHGLGQELPRHWPAPSSPGINVSGPNPSVETHSHTYLENRCLTLTLLFFSSPPPSTQLWTPVLPPVLGLGLRFRALRNYTTLGPWVRIFQTHSRCSGHCMLPNHQPPLFAR